MTTAREALERLRQGNRRFVAGSAATGVSVTPHRASDLVQRQRPFATILGCSDSRVPPEVVFDQGIGDLFVIRVAGHVVAPPQLGSVEFAVRQLATRLVVVLGHTRCGAVQATIDHLQRPSVAPSDSLRSILDKIGPSVEPLLATDLRAQPEELWAQAVRAHVRASVISLRDDSEISERLVGQEQLLIVGAECSLETGVVEFFDEPPSASRDG